MVYTLPAASTVDAYDVLLQGVTGRPTCCAHSSVGEVCAERQRGDANAIANSALVILFFISGFCYCSMQRCCVAHL